VTEAGSRPRRIAAVPARNRRSIMPTAVPESLDEWLEAVECWSVGSRVEIVEFLEADGHSRF
jgi:hypothetical protein